jgi:radical SAM protein with 4Fe4S-binding SPASM domain
MAEARKVLPPVLVSFSVTRQCNLKCVHCYSESVETAHPHELSTDEAKLVIQQIAQSGARMIIFDGGEPLMRPDIYQLVAFAKEVGLRPLMGTNATLITDQVAGQLVEAGIKALAISVDGDRAASHDKFRGAEGSFDATIAGIQSAARAGIPFQLAPCINATNKTQLAGVVKLGHKLGAVAVEVFDYIASGRGKVDRSFELSIEERKALVDEIIALQRKDDELVFRCIGIPQYWVEVEKLVPEEEVLLKFVRSCCGAGLRYACIMYEGTVYPCMVLQKVAGNVREQSFADIWRESEVFQILRERSKLGGKCGRCDYKELCGGARCKVFEATGELMAEDRTCWFTEEELKRR